MATRNIKEKWMTYLVCTQEKFYPLICLFSVLICMGSFFLAKELRLNTDLESLLPKTAPSVVAMEKLKAKSGGAQDFRLVLWGGDLEKRLEVARDFSDFLKMKNWASSVRFKTPKEFLEDKKLLLIPLDSLNAIHEKVLRERKEHADLVDPLGLESEPEDKTDPKVVDPKTERDEEKKLDEAKTLLHDLDQMQPYYQTPAGDYLVIRIIPNSSTLDIAANQELLDQLWGFVKEFDLARYGSEIQCDIHGSLQEQIKKFEAIKSDVSVGGLGILGILLVVILYFRTLWSLLVLLPPLVLGLLLGSGLVYLKEGKLNTIAAFLVVVVFGVGIEFGIHLWARYLVERKHKSVLEAMLATWRTTGSATLTSSTALLAGFALLSLSSFQGFAQFGRVAIILVIAVAGAFVLIMPSWIFLAEKLRGYKAWTHPLNQVWNLSRPFEWIFKPVMELGLRRLSVALFVAGVVLSIFYVRFDYQFEDTVQFQKRKDSENAIDRVFTERLKPSALAAFPSPIESTRFTEAFRKAKADYPDIALMSGLDTFYPLDQQARIKKLQLISEDLDDWWIRKIDDPRLRDVLYEMKERSDKLKPFTLDEVPPETREPFVASDGSGDRLVFIYDIGGETDGRKSMKFSDAVSRFLETNHFKTDVSGQEIILADIVRRVIEEGPWLLLGMLCLVALICWLDFKNPRDTFITMAPVIFGFILTSLMLLITGRKINFYNMVALASLGSMVVDNSIHLFHRYLEFKSDGIKKADLEATKQVAPTITLCTLTSILGYGGMAIANHSGVASLGWVAVSGLLCCLMSSVIFFPAWLRKFS